VWPALRRARRGEEAEEVRQMRSQLEGRWGELAEAFSAVAARYDEAYARLK